MMVNLSLKELMMSQLIKTKSFQDLLLFITGTIIVYRVAFLASGLQF